MRGRFDGGFSESGTAKVQGLAPRTAIVEMSEAGPWWLEGAEWTESGLSFRVGADRTYLAVSPEALARPELRRPLKTRLKNTSHRVDYLMLGPKPFVEAASGLLELRRQQGLRALGVALEDVVACPLPTGSRAGSMW